MKEPDFKSAKRQAPRVDPDKLNRLPPHSLEAEQGVLGCCLLDPQQVVTQLVADGFDAKWLYHLPHQTIFEHIYSVLSEKKGVDLITLMQSLKDSKQLDAVGGLAYLTSLEDAVPSSSNVNYYLEIVREKHLLRQMLRTASEAEHDVFNCETEVEKLVAEFQAKALALTTGGKAKFTTAKELMRSATNEIEARYNASQEGRLIGLPTGFPDLDKMTCGFQPGDMIVIAARPSCGKTALAMNIAEHMAVNEKIPVGVFSLEMSESSLGMRLIGQRGRVNIRSMRFTESDFGKMTRASGQIAESPLYIDDTPGQTIAQIRSRARMMVELHGVKAFVIDYLQLINGTGKSDKRHEEVAGISGGVKQMARELNVPVIILCQISREAEKEKRRPRKSDLRESGAIEQDADLIGFLFNPDDEQPDANIVRVKLFIAKQRNGPTGDIDLTFLKEFTRFESAARIDGSDIP